MPYDWALLGPLVLTVAAILLGRRLGVRYVSWITVWVALAMMATLPLILQGLYHEQWRAIFVAMTNLIALTSAWDSALWLRQHPRVIPHRYYFWWGLFWAALLGIALSQNLALSWLAVEFSTLASGALIIEMGDRHALEAAWKYLVIASVGLILGLIGIVFVYASLSSQGLGWSTLNFSNLRINAPHIAPIVRQLAAICIVSGFGTKAGLVPFHTWLPDAHSEAPSPVSGLLSGILLGLSLFTVARFIVAVPAPIGALLTGSRLLTVFGTASVVAGALALLVQRDVKRLLAYSSIEQTGLMAVALGIGSQAAMAAALLQFVLHAVIKSSLFYGAGHLADQYGTKALKQITGLLASRPIGAIFWALGLLALAGLPPLGLAYSEWWILALLWAHHDYLVILLVSSALTLTFAALAHHLMQTLWGTPQTLPATGAAHHTSAIQEATP
jgi:hydrogenase-4 component F